PVLPHEDRSEFNALRERYRSDFAPVTAHEEFLVEQMTGARWKLNRIERIESTIFTSLENADDPGSSEALSGLARLDRYRASLERTYHRAARELRATRKEQNEANSTEMAQKKFETLLKKMLDAPPPGYQFEPRLVAVDENSKNEVVSTAG